MKKSTIIIIIVLIVLALLLIFGLPAITGDVVSYSSVEKGNYMCEDSDGDLHVLDESIFVKGTVTKTSTSRPLNKVYEDVCASNTKIKEYYCTHRAHVKSKRYRCGGSCVDGACVK